MKNREESREGGRAFEPERKCSHGGVGVRVVFGVYKEIDGSSVRLITKGL